MGPIHHASTHAESAIRNCGGQCSDHAQQLPLVRGQDAISALRSLFTVRAMAGLRAELWICSPVWCPLRMGHGPELVGDAAAAGCLVETILISAADFVAVTRGHQCEYLVPRRAAVNAVLLLLVSGSDRRNGRERERKT